ncbi:MAG TPA: hypothetical protein VG456_13205 [Candidatus Sulfopaludibacter sp.]|jgi:hypothetical protein|nr:hypothetical protein [Candidatus Sulfopaludibacter sp.]
MKRIHVTFSIEELSLLASLASDQLFRREFIDPRMPGYKANPSEVQMGKALVNRLRSTVDDATKHPNSAAMNGSAKGQESL